MAKLNLTITALALAVTSAIAYVACVLLIAVFGQPVVSLFGTIFHGIDITKIATTGTSLTDIATGFVVIFVLALFAGALFAKVYNWFAKGK
ncbi:MAG: hypothetical protein HYW23_02460 [Candidatus Aenigmarchaeota archaeon]|nr:hypothetical protein [Candidatus Aenigmarchaeota archaeon]